MKVRILQKIPTDENTHEALNKAEREWILIYRTNERAFGYNMDTGGKNPLRSPEWNAKISKANKGRKHTGEALKNIRTANTKTHEANRGRKHTGQALANMRAAFKRNIGKKHNAESIKKMSIAHRKGNACPEYQAKFKAAQNRPEVVAKRRKLNCKPVIVTDANGVETEYYSASEASRVLSTPSIKFRRRNICAACTGTFGRNNTHTYKGLIFKYKN